MNLKTQTDYALRTLLYLAFREQQSSVEEIANSYKISKDHLVKVVQQLVRLGYVNSRAGRTGGIRLAKDPAEIRIGDIVSQMEGRSGVLPCISDKTYCNIDPGCALKSLLMAAEESFFSILNRSTIADMVKSNKAKGSGGLFHLNLSGLKKNDRTISDDPVS